MVSVAATPAIPTPQFFVSQKRGEICELRHLLKSLPTDNAIVPENRQKRRDVLKRLVAYMTLGIDVCPLFPEVVLASATPDPIQKKLITLYLANYSETNPELTVLAINTFQKDLSDYDPRIRGLALRAMASLRVRNVLEYADSAILNGLNDTSSYVRRIAVMSISKLLRFGPRSSPLGDSPENIESLIQSKLYENDSQLVINTLITLNEIYFASEGGYKTPISVLYSLINRLPSFHVFGKVYVLSLMASYSPSCDEEIFRILDLVDEFLCLASPSIVMACLKLMMKMSICSTRSKVLQDACLRRIKPAFLTLLVTSSPEMQYSLLRELIHVCRIIGPTFSEIFSEDYDMFIPQFTDKDYNVHCKIILLHACLTEANVLSVMNSLLFFVFCPSSLNATSLKLALRMLGIIGVNYPQYIQDLLPVLAELMCLGSPQIVSAVLPILGFLFPKCCTGSCSSEQSSATLSLFVPIFNSILYMVPYMDLECLKCFLWMTSEFEDFHDIATHLCSTVLEHRPVSGDDPVCGDTTVENNKIFGSDFLDTSDKSLKDSCSSVWETESLLLEVLDACLRVLLVDDDRIRPVLMALIERINSQLSTWSVIFLDRLAFIVTCLASGDSELITSLFSGSSGARRRYVSSMSTHKMALCDVTVGAVCSINELNTLASTFDVSYGLYRPTATSAPPFGGLMCHESDLAASSSAVASDPHPRYYENGSSVAESKKPAEAMPGCSESLLDFEEEYDSQTISPEEFASLWTNRPTICTVTDKLETNSISLSKFESTLEEHGAIVIASGEDGESLKAFSAMNLATCPGSILLIESLLSRQSYEVCHNVKFSKSNVTEGAAHVDQHVVSLFLSNVNSHMLHG